VVPSRLSGLAVVDPHRGIPGTPGVARLLELGSQLADQPDRIDELQPPPVNLLRRFVTARNVLRQTLGLVAHRGSALGRTKARAAERKGLDDLGLGVARDLFENDDRSVPESSDNPVFFLSPSVFHCLASLEHKQKRGPDGRFVRAICLRT